MCPPLGSFWVGFFSSLTIPPALMSNLLIDEPPLQVLPSLAERIGLNEAILLQQLHYWTQRSGNIELDQHGQERRWVWKTLDGWSEEFPFWSRRTIQRTLRSLTDDGLVVAEQKRKDQGDMTTWYAVGYEALPNTSDCLDASGQDDQVGTTDCPHGGDRVSNSAPAHDADAPSETTTENTTEKEEKERARPPAETSAHGGAGRWDWVPEQFEQEVPHMEDAIQPILAAKEKEDANPMTELERAGKRLLSGTRGRIKVPPQRLLRQVKEHGLEHCIGAWVAAETKEQPYEYAQALLDNRFYNQDEQPADGKPEAIQQAEKLYNLAHSA
jgi:hypothetical protein